MVEIEPAPLTVGQNFKTVEVFLQQLRTYISMRYYCTVRADLDSTGVLTAGEGEPGGHWLHQLLLLHT